MWFFKNKSGWCQRHGSGSKDPGPIRKSQAPILRKLQAQRASSIEPQASSLKQAIDETVPWNEVLEAHGSGPTDPGPIRKSQAPILRKLQAQRASSAKLLKPQAASIKPQA